MSEQTKDPVTLLLNDLRSMFTQQAAPSNEISKRFLKEHEDWYSRGADVAREAQRLTQAGRAAEAQELLATHQSLRPRKPTGRPRSAAPSSHQLRAALLNVLAHNLCAAPATHRTELLRTVAQQFTRR